MQGFGVDRLPSAGVRGGGLPAHGGVYIVYAPQYGILYVGCSKDIRNRWQQHHWRYQLTAIPDARIAWISVDDGELRKALEKTLINRLKPPINTQVSTATTDIRRQWFQKFKQDGYYPQFEGYTARKEVGEMINYCLRCGKYDCQCWRVQDLTDKHGVKYFHDHNGSRVDYPTGTVFSDGYVQPEIATVREEPQP